MKRIPQKRPSTYGKHAVALDPTRLDAVRGGGDLGIAIRVPDPVHELMQVQHNELLIAQRRRKRP